MEFFSRPVFLNIFIFIFTFKSIKCQCNVKETCHDCIQDLKCDWCIENYPTCIERSSNRRCNGRLISPKSNILITKNIPLSINTVETPITQMQPQQISLNLRKGEEYNFTFKYKPVKFYPIDLYYLMDVSASMKQHKEQVAELGGTISDTMRHITNDFRLGFGTFIDKPTLPFADPMKQYKYDVEPPYGFRNHLPLTQDFKQFIRKVRTTRQSENIDVPEGGLDSILQAIVCLKEVQWRSQARRLIVFATDASFHISGDGKFGGIVEPNDGECHVVNGEYMGSLLYDYPSISQIKHAALSNDVYIIFAIANAEVYQEYTDLADYLKPVAYVGLINEESSNIQEIIVNNYKKIMDSVTITTDSPKFVIQIDSNCKNKTKSGCLYIHQDEVIEFTATIKAAECINNKNILIKPDGMEDNIMINLNVICSCDCEKYPDPDFVENSNICSNNGNMECGACNCKAGFYGNNCECQGSQDLNIFNLSLCQPKLNSPICSDRGDCFCNTCHCSKLPNNQKIYGKFCECDNFSCNKNNNLLCNNRGTCDCGKCLCQEGWSGEACECLPVTSCKASSDELVCSGRGSCSCGLCLCDMPFTGKYCEICTNCGNRRCEELRHCVECQVYHTGKYNKDECNQNCIDFTTIAVDKFGNMTNTEDCIILDDDDCKIIFKYFEFVGLDLSLKVVALNKKQCSEKMSAWALAGIIIGSMLLAALVGLVSWKIATTVNDRREYAKFEESSRGAYWANKNPLYKNVVTSHVNPHYKSKKENSEDEDESFL
ncbi:unnamed protein product [Brassicogethes aeneus]|uniref:Integrin beta n=1 Tax=Brassicogethes aeneus TaxID=1431903 RepID=A0A9P0B3V0_BRAAE|nr:unnamed protein product [Brassicogethes aeneus]